MEESAEEDLESLDSEVRRRIIKKIDWFVDNFNHITPVPLKGNLSNFYKLRVGDWRVFYKIDWDSKTLFVSYVDHRSNSYR